MLEEKSLLNKILKSSLNKKERDLINGFIEYDNEAKKRIKKTLKRKFFEESNNVEDAFLVFNKLRQEEENKSMDESPFDFRKIAAASVIVLMICLLGYNSLIKSKNIPNTKMLNRDIVLTMPDGRKTVVDETASVNQKIQNLFVANENTGFDTQALSSIYVPKGKTYKMELSDGTIVHLNADTRLKFPISFENAAMRKVELIGEGFFEVVSNKEKAFVVQSEGLETKVFGTKFNISSYEGSDSNRITLVEGSVGVTSVEDNVRSMLKPNEMFTWEKKNQRYSISKVDVDESTSWLRGLVSFNNTSLAKMIPVIERKFDIKVKLIDENTKAKRFTGELSVNTIEELQAILDATKVFSCAYQANEKILLIK